MEFLVLLGFTSTRPVLVSRRVRLAIAACVTNYSPVLPLAFAAVPNCQDYVDCLGCASQEECAWCASDNTCSTISDVFERDCRGLVFEPPCPTDFVPENVVVGNLVVRADATFGGGEVNISGVYEVLPSLRVTSLICGLFSSFKQALGSPARVPE
jgi:hypothetical protein